MRMDMASIRPDGQRRGPPPCPVDKAAGLGSEVELLYSKEINSISKSTSAAGWPGLPGIPSDFGIQKR